MKRINDLHACLFISIIVHAGIMTSGMFQFDLFPQDKPFEVAFEIEEEILPEVYELKEEKKIEPPVIEPEDVIEPVEDEAVIEELDPPQEDEEMKKSLLRYQDSIKQKIQENKRYPRWALRARHQGVALVVFDVKPGGDIGNLKLRQSSGFKELDQEARDVVKRAAPFLGFPQGMEVQKITIEVNIVFMLDD